MKISIILLIQTLFTTFTSAGLLPDYDPRCDSMNCHRAEIHLNESLYLPVPKIVHQIWFGDRRNLNPDKPYLWEIFCSSFGYEYRFWSESDEEFFRSEMLPRNFELLKKLLIERQYWAASDVLRCEILKKLGGIYVDCDFSPPQQNGKIIDLGSIINPRGLTVMTECHGRNIGQESALFVCNGFLISPPNHPVIRSMVEQFYDNTNHWYHREKNYDAMFITGPFLLNKVLNGSFNVVPYSYVKQLHMFE